MSEIIICVLAVLLAVAISFGTEWHNSRSESMLDQWVHQHGFVLLESECRYLFRGPFQWSTARAQMVYHVQVRDRQGVVRSGWVRCGSLFWGVASDQIEVRWENEVAR